MKKILLRLLALIAFLPILSSCYVPDDFTCEIRVAKSGNYSMTYDGVLVWAPLVSDIYHKKVTDREVSDINTSLYKELKRIPEFSEITQLSPGKFRVKYQKNGTFTEPTEINFPRNGAAVMTLQMRLDGTLRIWSTAKPKMTELQKLDEAGITSHGKLRILTNVDIEQIKIRTAATLRPLPGYDGWHYVDWTIASLGQPPPDVLMRLYPEGTLKDPHAK